MTTAIAEEGRRLLDELPSDYPFNWGAKLSWWLWTHREELVRCAEERAAQYLDAPPRGISPDNQLPCANCGSPEHSARACGRALVLMAMTPQEERQLDRDVVRLLRSLLLYDERGAVAGAFASDAAQLSGFVRDQIREALRQKHGAEGADNVRITEGAPQKPEGET